MAELTKRQGEVLLLIVEGLTTKQMARRLEIAAKTVDCHRTALRARLGIGTIAGLVRYAIRTGLVNA